MMKIKNEEDVFIIPANYGLHILSTNQYKESLIEYLTSYFTQKKKTKCIVVDDEEEIIDSKGVEFIYIPSHQDFKSVFDFKAKTDFNTELSEMIMQNSELFLTIDQIRKNAEELMTDQGIYQFKRILEQDTHIHLQMDTMNFEIQKLLQLFRIDVEPLSMEQQYMILYNLLLYISREQFQIIYIDFDLNAEVYDWLIQKKNNNSLILVENECVHSPIPPIFDSFIFLNQSDAVYSTEVDSKQTELLSYLFHPIVRENIDKQTEKNIAFLSQFETNQATFFCEFTPLNI